MHFLDCIFTLAVVFAVAGCELPCTELKNEWQKKFTARNWTYISERKLRYRGTDEVVHVWGDGGAPRAAAAALFVIVHYLLGYAAQLHESDIDLWKSYKEKSYAIIAPVATWPHSRSGENIVGYLDMISSMSGPVAPHVPTLQAYVPHSKCTRDASVWTFFIEKTNIDRCNFLRVDGKDGKHFFKVLARNRTINDARALKELEERNQANNLSLRIVPLQSDLHLRKEILQLQLDNTSFLFLDEDIWHKHPFVLRVQIPAFVELSMEHSMNLSYSVVRVGDGIFMRAYAHAISHIIRHMTLEQNHLQQILKDEQNYNTITEAACLWARKNIQRIFDENVQYANMNLIYIIIVYNCMSNPDIEIHKAAMEIVKGEINKGKNNATLKTKMILLNCSNVEMLRTKINADADNKTVIGNIALSSIEGIASAAAAADYNTQPLFVVGPTTPDLQLRPTVRASTGRIVDLTQAYQHFFQLCGWSRLAIISDSSSYSKHFQDVFLTQNLNYRVETVFSSHDIPNIMESLRADDARVFFINANWNVTRDILCAAVRLHLNTAGVYAWIVRDWRHVMCDDKRVSTGMYFYSINLSWRGGNETGNLTIWQSKLREKLSENLIKKQGKFILPVETASLVDALLQLSHGFNIFLQKHRSYLYDIRDKKTYSYFSNILDNQTVSGISQNLRNENYSIKDPVVYIEKWTLDEGYNTAAIWRVTPEAIVQEWPRSPIINSCETLLGSKPVANGPRCFTIHTGDIFAPRCHDLAIILAMVFFILLGIGLFLARRARLKRLNSRYKSYEDRITKVRERATSTLVTYLVDRSAIKILHEIGSGNYGRVHFAEFRKPEGDTVMVAAKEPRKEVPPAEENEFLREACVLAPLFHQNIIRLIGVCIVNGPPMVLMEHALYLDLQRYLIERRQLAVKARFSRETTNIDIELSNRSLTRLAREAAGALEYLATRRLVHRDVRAANCLVDKERSLKLADFGMARELDKKEPEYATTRRGLFPVLWMAPESLKLGIFSHASDVWALGVLILEVATLGARPYGDWSPAQVLQYVTEGGHPLLPPDISKPTRSVVLGCWERKVDLRPSAAEVHSFLTENPEAISSALLMPLAP